MGGVPVNGDNSDANYDYNNQGVCGARSDRRALWYEINGIGKEVTVNVCTNNDKITDFGIFHACNTQNCLGAPPQQMEPADCGEEQSNAYSFLAKNGDSYYVHVRSDVVFEGRAAILPYGTQNQQTNQHRRPTLVDQCPLALRRSMALVVVCYSGALLYRLQ